jgi:protein O-mannosyl-transferase
MNKIPLFSRASCIAGSVLLFLVCVVVYFPFFQNGFIWDDDKYLTDNPYLNNLDGLKQLWFDFRAMPQYYPLVFTSFWVENQIWGLNPFGYHVDNVIIHCLNAIILWRILTFLNIKGSWLAAAIFLIHPIQVESVAWVTERKNLLSGFFYLLSLYFFLRFYNPSLSAQENQNIKNSWALYGFSIFFFICALWSKTVACTLPAAILLIYWWKQNSISKKLVLTVIPFFAIGLGFAFLTIWLERFSVGAIGQEWDFSFWDRFLIAGRALWFYMGKLLWPFPIIFTYPRWSIDDSSLVQYVYPLAFLLLISVFWAIRKRIGRGPLTAILFFAGSLFPALGFFNVYPMKYSFVADHFQYLPCIGIIVVFTSGLNTLITERTSRIVYIASVGLLLFLGYSTWSRGPVYKDSVSLWQDTIKKNPSAWMAHNNLGKISADNGMLKESINHYKNSIEAKSDYFLPHYNLGIAYAETGDFEEAINQYRTAIKITPRHFGAHNNLGDTLVKSGKILEAISHYKTAIKMNPDFAPAHFGLGLALTMSQNTQEAIHHYRIAIKINPEFFLAHNNLANALTKAGLLEEALAHYKIAIKISPDYFQAHFNLGNALASNSNLDEAIIQYKIAIKIKPEDAQAQNNLGISLAKKGDLEEAIIYFKNVIVINPDDAMAHNNLGGALLMEGKNKEAASHFRSAIKIRPDYADALKNLKIALYQTSELR